MPSVPRHVFVYGTLRRGESRDINMLRPPPEWVGFANINGVLFDLGCYPGIVLKCRGEGGGPVKGEVYVITPALERQLDKIEEVWPQQSGEYCKREAIVRLCLPADAAAQSLSCLLYEVAPERVSGYPVINNGDWVPHHKHRPGSVADE